MSETIEGGGLTLDGPKNDFKVRTSFPLPELSLKYFTELLEVDHFRFFFLPLFVRGCSFEGIIIGGGVATLLLCGGTEVVVGGGLYDAYVSWRLVSRKRSISCASC